MLCLQITSHQYSVQTADPAAAATWTDDADG